MSKNKLKHIKLWETYDYDYDEDFIDDGNDFEDYYFSNIDSIISYDINILKTVTVPLTEDRLDGENHIITVDAMPKLDNGFNHKHSDLEEMVHFLSVYTYYKDSELSKIVEESSISDMITIENLDDGSKNSYSVSDISDFQRNLKRRSNNNSTQFTDEHEEITTDTPESLYKEGDTVLYLPKLSGLDSKKVFRIQSKFWKDSDELSDALGVEFIPSWYYSFKGSNLIAKESDLKSK